MIHNQVRPVKMLPNCFLQAQELSRISLLVASQLSLEANIGPQTGRQIIAQSPRYGYKSPLNRMIELAVAATRPDMKTAILFNDSDGFTDFDGGHRWLL